MYLLNAAEINRLKRSGVEVIIVDDERYTLQFTPRSGKVLVVYPTKHIIENYSGDDRHEVDAIGFAVYVDRTLVYQRSHQLGRNWQLGHRRWAGLIRKCGFWRAKRVLGV